ncbi:YrdC/Sua5 family protein [Caenispirillum salinarum AK4]|uniref:Threonylcarbamoyl-AMP synthase n=1 Tax=Caenispirillum salinarum AK4 TaxID=1238182 RepID=K9HPT7_9PROT|nr:L-threonylcarbamoyladenylate synthase [Caenispirillum salinarum]EKV30486.1 YrdC/Sua5 family protein [Caenispirillum salinarum AK4]
MSRIRPAADATLAEAGRLLRDGALVAFPTETVYGLGGDATSESAVAGIFEAKGRPRFNPLIVHVPDAAAAARLVEMDDRAKAVADAFWPGPLTLVLPRRADSGLSLLVSAGLDSVAVRVPAHPVAQGLLRAAGRPVAAPSANRSGAISPTRAAHVEESLGDRVALIVDGGPCAVGLESTVLDLTTPTATILRPGAITAADLEPLIGPVAESGGEGQEADPAAPKSPGQLLSHYAPDRPVRLNATAAEPGEALIGFGGTAGAEADLSSAGDVKEAAAALFATLRALDRPPFTGIAVAPIPDEGLGRAINDRLKRAAAPRA